VSKPLYTFFLFKLSLFRLSLFRIILFLQLPLIWSHNKLKKNESYKQATISQDKQERIELFTQVQKELRKNIQNIKEKIASDYQIMNKVAERLNKLELMHRFALEFEETIKQTQKELKKRTYKKDPEELDKPLRFAQLAIREVEKAQKIIFKHASLINNEFDKLFGVADKVFEKAHIAHAQKNINLATEEFAQSLKHSIQAKPVFK